MNAPTKHALGQLRRIDLLALAIEAGAAPESIALRLGSQSKEQVIAALTRTGPMARLTERAGRRLVP